MCHWWEYMHCASSSLAKPTADSTDSQRWRWALIYVRCDKDDGSKWCECANGMMISTPSAMTSMRTAKTEMAGWLRSCCIRIDRCDRHLQSRIVFSLLSEMKWIKTSTVNVIACLLQNTRRESFHRTRNNEYFHREFCGVKFRILE